MRWIILIALALLGAAARTTAAQCGGDERWAVKMGADQGAALIDLTPVRITLNDLVHIARPTLPSDDITRVPQERVVRMLDAVLVRFQKETGKKGDADYHLVLTDETQQFSPHEGPVSPHSVIAEIPNPDCVGGRDGSVTGSSQLAAQLRTVRSRFEQQFATIKAHWNETGGIPVRVTGVVFFDRQHGQIGRALNGVELHPVLDIVFNPPPLGPVTTPVIAASNITASNTTPPTSVALANPGFELGPAGWTASPDVIHVANDEQPRSGDRMAWLGGYGSAHTDKLSQEITLPASAQTVTLSFFLHIDTEEPSTGVADRLRVRVRSANGALLRTLQIFSNLDAADGFQRRTFDLTEFRGRTVTISLEAVENSANVTSFVVDDFSLLIQ